MPVINGGMTRKVQAGPAQVSWFVRAMDDQTKKIFATIMPAENFVGKKACSDGEHELFTCTEHQIARLNAIRTARNLNFTVYKQENRPPKGIGEITPFINTPVIDFQQSALLA